MATPPKPPKDIKPAARRGPRKTSASATRRPAAAPAPKVEAKTGTKAGPKTPASAPSATAAKAPRASAVPRAKAAPRGKTAQPTGTPPTSSAPKAATATVPSRTATPAAVTKVVAETVSRNRWTIGAVVAAVGAGFAAFLTRGRIATALGRSEGHEPTDLLDTGAPGLAKTGDDRAIPAFRPDMDAPMTAAEREALRPATGSAPSLASDSGSLDAQTGPAN